MYDKLWRILDKISISANCQMIATTHSYEMIAAVQGGLEHTDDFSYYRIGCGKQGHVAYHYDYTVYLETSQRFEL